MKITDLKNYTVVGSANPVAVPRQNDALKTATDITTSIFPGGTLGKAIGNSFAMMANPDTSKTQDQIYLDTLNVKRTQALRKGEDTSHWDNLIKNFRPSDTSIKQDVTPGQVAGDVANIVATTGGLALPVPSTFLKSVGQYSALGALGAGGESAARGNSAGEVLTDSAKGGVIGGAVGGAFNLLGKGISALARKTAPSTLSFTSGVPKAAIEQTIKNPTAAKQGLNMNVEEVRKTAIDSLNGLYKDLGNEFSTGLKTVKQTVPDITKSVGTEAPNAIPEIQKSLINSAKTVARDYRVSFAKNTVNFSKSNIVSSAEQKNVEQAISTLKTWEDFSPQGVQDLAERIGALRKFESGAQTKGSAIIGKIYNNVAGENGVIQKLYPELKDLRTNFATNKKVLDEIKNVLSADKTKPTQVQAAVTRLDTMFAQNKDEYVNVIRQLGEKSGVDFLSILAGGEFQKYLPNFVRGLGGGGALSVGATLINPYVLLLAPLFSPRAVGSLVRNAPNIAKTASTGARSVSTRAIQELTPKQESKRPK